MSHWHLVPPVSLMSALTSHYGMLAIMKTREERQIRRGLSKVERGSGKRYQNGARTQVLS